MVKLFAVIFLCSLSAFAQVSPIAIVDSTVRGINGSLASGTIVVRYRSGAPAGVTLASKEETISVLAGVVNSKLYQGSYTVTYRDRDPQRTVYKTATWTVPASGPVTIRDIESSATTTPIYSFAYSLVSGLSLGSFTYGGPSGTVLLAAPADGLYNAKFSASIPSWSISPPIPSPMRVNTGVGSYLFHVNNHGVAVGLKNISGDNWNGVYHALVVYPDSRGAVDLGVMGGYRSEAADVNDAGEICGHVDLTSNRQTIQSFFRAADGTLTIFGDPTKITFATSIDADGTVAGYRCETWISACTAFTRTKAGVLTDLGLFGSTAGVLIYAYRGGWIGGALCDGDPAEIYTCSAFTRSPAGVVTNIGKQGMANAWVTSINSQGKAVGEADAEDYLTAKAFSWTPSGGTVDLMSTIGLPSAIGNGVNESGDITLLAGDDVEAVKVMTLFANGELITQGTFGGPDRVAAGGISDNRAMAVNVYSASTHYWTGLVVPASFAPMPNASAKARGLLMETDYDLAVPYIQASNPGCTVQGREWLDTTTTTTVVKRCLVVSGTLQWVTK